MEIILSKNLKSLTGKLSKRSTFAIRERDGHFYTTRTTKNITDPNEHLRYIFDVAKMAKNGFMIANIVLPVEEFVEAINEAQLLAFIPAKQYFDVQDVLDFKKNYDL